MKDQNKVMSAEIKNVPKKIYLQIDADGEEITDFKELHQVTWCGDKIHKTDLAYVLESELSQRIDELAERIINEADIEIMCTHGYGDLNKSSILKIANDFKTELNLQSSK